jgi:hypothetical protein
MRTWGVGELVRAKFYLNVIALVVKATLPEKPVMDNMVNVKLVEQRITVLQRCQWRPKNRQRETKKKLTFETEAVNTTTSYSSPTLFMN